MNTGASACRPCLYAGFSTASGAAARDGPEVDSDVYCIADGTPRCLSDAADSESDHIAYCEAGATGCHPGAARCQPGNRIRVSQHATCCAMAANSGLGNSSRVISPLSQLPPNEAAGAHFMSFNFPVCHAITALSRDAKCCQSISSRRCNRRHVRQLALITSRQTFAPLLHCHGTATYNE